MVDGGLAAEIFALEHVPKAPARADPADLGFAPGAHLCARPFVAYCPEGPIARCWRSDDDGASCAPIPSPGLARLDDTVTRLDSVLDARLRRVEEQQAREDAAQRRADAQRAREDALACRQIGEQYDPAFMAHGTATPPPIDDEAPGKYRRRLFTRLQRKLPDSHKLADLDAYDLPLSVLRNFEQALIEAATGEGEHPSEANLPEDGTMIEKHRVDSMGQRFTEFHGRRSFIADMGRPGQRVLRLCNPRTGDVLKGPPFAKDPRQALWS